MYFTSGQDRALTADAKPGFDTTTAAARTAARRIAAVRFYPRLEISIRVGVAEVPYQPAS